jgi:hypothetical protein
MADAGGGPRRPLSQSPHLEGEREGEDRLLESQAPSEAGCFMRSTQARITASPSRILSSGMFM